MSKENAAISISRLDELHTNGAGYDVLRYVGLPDLFGKEANTLLYFMGKNLARKIDINSLEDIYYTYEKLGWGRLELVKEKRSSLTFNLMADAIVHRLKGPFETEFRLEAGFLAKSIQKIKDTECECTEEINHKIHQVQFKVFYTE